MAEHKPRISRRGFAGLLAVSGAGVLAGGWIIARHVRRPPPPPYVLRRLRPTELPIRVITDARQTAFTGDDFTRPHAFLWERAGRLAAKGGAPEPSERANVVVVGGGISGLCAAYLMRDLRPILLEQGEQLGGNSRGEQWGELRYSIGAAYISPPEPGGEIDRLFRDLGIAGDLRRSDASEGGGYVLGGRLHAGFWRGESDPARAADFRRVLEVLRRYYDEEYVDIPPGAAQEAELRRLDAMTFEAWVAAKLGPLHPHVAEAFDLYSWSTYGGTVREVSAAQMLYFLSSDVREVAAFPGGNSAISQALVQKLERGLPMGSLRPRSLVVQVAPHAEGVTVTYEDRPGTLRTILAKRCVVACAKFIAKHVVQGVPAAQRAAMSRLRYRAYLVANVLLHRRVPIEAYDCWRLTGRRSRGPREGFAERPFTDLVFAGWAAHDRPARSGLPLYKPVAYDGGRAEVFVPDAFATQKAKFEAAIPEIVQLWGVTERDVAGVRVTRWGHPLPLAERGLLADGIAQRACAPVDGRIFFAQQDNWCSPAFEPAFGSVRETVAALRRTLRA